MSTTPLIIEGHRGFPSRAHENTLDGFRIALEEGISGIEFDIWLTLDRVLVIAHGCNNQGLDKLWDPIKQQYIYVFIPKTTFTQLKQYRIADKKTEVCTLEDVFDAIGYQTSMYLNIEIKPDSDKIVEEAIKLIKKKKVTAKLEFCTFVHRLKPVVKHWCTQLERQDIGFTYNIHYIEEIQDKVLLDAIVADKDNISLDISLVLMESEEVVDFIQKIRTAGGIIKCYNYMSLTDLEGEELFVKLMNMRIDTFILNAPEKLIDFNRKL